MTDDLVDHYRARAKGGVGLIITEVVTVEPTYTYLPGDMCCYNDTFIPGWEKLAAAVHEYGCKIMPQLFHPAYMAFNIPGTPRLIAPSFVGPSYAREAPRPITVDEIHELTHQLATLPCVCRRPVSMASRSMRRTPTACSAVFDSALQQAHRRVRRLARRPHAFPARSHRRDSRALRQGLYHRVRISGDEYTDGGLTLNDMIYVSRRLEKAVST